MRVPRRSDWKCSSQALLTVPTMLLSRLSGARTHVDRPRPCSPFTAESNLNAKHPKEGLRPRQLASSPLLSALKRIRDAKPDANWQVNGHVCGHADSCWLPSDYPYKRGNLTS
jgi:hypothetical protein